MVFAFIPNMKENIPTDSKIVTILPDEKGPKHLPAEVDTRRTVIVFAGGLAHDVSASILQHWGETRKKEKNSGAAHQGG